MKPLLNHTCIIDLIDLQEYYEHFRVDDVISLDNNKCLITFSPFKNPDDFYNIERLTRKQISLPISVFTTSYGRIHITQFINRDELELYYTDTDSLDFKGELDSKLIGDIIGQWKIEGVFKRVAYPAPKIYSAEIDNNAIKLNKAKGLKDKNLIDINLAIKLLNKDTKVTFNQEKWFRSISNSEIEIKFQPFTLQSINNKRKPIYNNNIWVDTDPIIIES